MTASEEPQTPNEPRVLDAGALRALGHPLRVKIYEAISQRGPQTASSLATLLDESSGATSYHLRSLARHGLIQESTGKRSGRERWWEHRPGGITISSHAVSGSPAGQAALQLAVGELLRLRYDESLAYFTSGIDREPPEWVDASISLTSGIPMTAAQTKELIDEIRQLVDAAANKYRGQTGDGLRKVTVRPDIFPLPDTSTTTEQTS